MIGIIILLILAVIVFLALRKGWANFRDGKGGILSHLYSYLRKMWNIIV